MFGGETALGSRDVRMWCCATEALSGRDVERAVETLSAGERRRHDRLRRPEDRRDYAVAHAFLRLTLASLTDVGPKDVVFETGMHGKPRLVSPGGFFFSLSHTDGMAAWTVTTTGEVGVDVERLRPSIDAAAMAGRYFDAMESQYVMEAPPSLQPTRFCELWTLKEAYLKARGVGLREPLDAVAFAFAEGGITCRAATSDGEWDFALFEPAPAHMAAVALPRPGGVRCRLTASLVDVTTSIAMTPVRSTLDLVA